MKKDTDSSNILYFKILLLILCVTTFFSCSDVSSKNFVGIWCNHYLDTFEVKNEGDSFGIKIHMAGAYGNYTYKFKDGALVGDKHLGNIHYSVFDSSEHLLFGDLIFERCGSNH